MIQRILIVDDEPDIRELLEITLGRMNLETTSAQDLTQARELLAEKEFQLCLTDMRLPDGDGIDLVKDIQHDYPQMPVAVITAHGSTETAIHALKSGAFDFISKPIDLVKLRSIIQSALKLSSNIPEYSQSSDKNTVQLIGQSEKITHLKNQIQKLARSQAPVFISGDSGSGKELVARSIHTLGPRKDKEFVPINCGAIPSELMESEFFGHVKGSFTGATSDKIGLFQAADGGSLFLDEIADLPLQMQVKLLRAIQEKTVRPVGSQAEVPVDVRIISATHKNLAEEVEKGHLRQDLFYRIHVIELLVPSLKERMEDLPLLANHVLSRLSQEQGTNPIKISDDAMEKLRRHDFPGNVRELENILHRASALAEDHLITLNDLPALSSSHNPASALTHTELDFLSKEDFSLEQHLEEIEKEAIKKALEATRWNKTKAAEKLGMSFRSFRYRLKKLGLD